MKILLLKPINDRYYVVQPSLGLGYLASVIIREGHEAHIIDAGRERLTWDAFRILVEEGGYDLIGIQMFSYELPSVKKHLEIVKKYSPESVTLVGGPHISGDPEGTADYLDGMNFGFVGEAETGLGRFLGLRREDYSNPERLEGIPNLVWRRNGRTVVNPRAPVADPDEIELPAWHLMDPRSYPSATHGIFYRFAPVAPIITSRGCPFPCTFCAARALTGPVIRYRSVENVVREIMLLNDRYGVREFHIEDDNFTWRGEYVIAFCREILKRNLHLAFTLPNGVRLDSLDEEVLILMERSGFYSLAVGIESGSDRILKLMKKNLTREVIREKIGLIKECTKMRISGFFLIGYPGETEAEIAETISFARSLNLDLASFLITMPLPGSPLWDDYGKRDYNEINWEDFIPSRAVPGVSDIPGPRLKNLQRKAILGFYLRPKILGRTLKEIKRLRQYRIIGRRLKDILRPVR
ncbi:MAG: radical SAM protein [PVC group bacterium]